MNRQKDSYFKRNVFGVAIVEFFWGLGFPIVLESTFLQLFLKNLGASSFVIGFVPALFILGVSTFPIFSSYLSRNLRFKKPLVALLHVISGLSIVGFGLMLLVVRNSADVLPLFFFFYTIFSLCMGLTIPIWLNFLVRIFSTAKTVPGLGYMMLAQNVGKVVSSLFILKVVEKYSFSPISSAYVFIATGLLLSIGSLSFFLTKEIADPQHPERDNLSFLHHTRQSFAEILNNRPFLMFLAADLDFYLILTTLSFYANYATTYYGVRPSVAAGVFVACMYGGSITVNIFLGALNLLRLKQKFILAKVITLLMLVLLVFLPGTWSFFLISAMLGVVRAIRNMVYPPMVKKFSGTTDSTTYFALAPVLTLPIGTGFPLIFGKLLDTLSFMQQDAYKLLFSCAALVLVVTIYLSLKIDYCEK